MTPDTRKSYFLSIGIFCALLVTFLVPSESSSRMIAAILLLLAMALTLFLLKKRNILSINRGQVSLIMLVMGLLYLMLNYLSGIYFGFYKYVGFSLDSFLYFILPIATIIISVEIIRRALLTQEKTGAKILTYLISVIAEILIVSNFWNVDSFNEFMDVVGMTFFPAAMGNLLYQYLSKRYGAISIIPYRLIIALYPYVITRVPAVPDAILALFNILTPIVIYFFVKSLYEKKPQRAVKKKSKWRFVGYILTAIVMISIVMLISCQFRFGALVIGSESMTGELNVGDTVIYERYDEQEIEEGQVIVFKNGKLTVIHRVVDIKRINGHTRYYTKGDANNAQDTGYRTDADIIGLTQFKIAYIGYPTLWLRSLFNR